jgi:hypothetical protein
MFMSTSSGTSGTSTSSGTGSASVDAAISKFQAAANAAAAESINTSTEITAINGVDNAIKKISPA